MDLFDLSTQDLINLNRKELENKIGRKLELKERFALRIIRKRLMNKSEVETHIEPLAIIGLITSFLSLPIPLLVVGPIGIVLGSIAWYRINQEPVTRKGKGIVIVGIILGLLGLIKEVFPSIFE